MLIRKYFLSILHLHLLLFMTASLALSGRISDEKEAPTAAAPLDRGGPPQEALTRGGRGDPPAPTLTFFMHDILGGSHPSTRAVTGVVASPAGQIPFAKPKGANLPLDPGVPLDDRSYGIVNNNNVPLLTGLSGEGELDAAAIDGKMPAGSIARGLMFGTMTVINDELTEGLDIGSRVIGKAQGFYVVSTVEGDSQTMAFTAMFEGGGYDDSLSFLGVHRTTVSESHLAVMGGTGKYLGATGFAVLKTLPAAAHMHRTDGLETLLKCTVYLL